MSTIPSRKIEIKKYIKPQQDVWLGTLAQAGVVRTRKNQVGGKLAKELGKLSKEHRKTRLSIAGKEIKKVTLTKNNQSSSDQLVY